MTTCVENNLFMQNIIFTVAKKPS